MCCSVNNIYHTCINFCSCGGWEKRGVLGWGGGIVTINENCNWEEQYDWKKVLDFVVRSSKYDGLTFSYMVINLFYIISASVKN